MLRASAELPASSAANEWNSPESRITARLSSRRLASSSSSLMLAQAGQLLGRERFDQASQHRRLDQAARFEDVARLLDRRLGDVGAALGIELDDLLVGESCQHLAHARAARRRRSRPGAPRPAWCRAAAGARGSRCRSARRSRRACSRARAAPGKRACAHVGAGVGGSRAASVAAARRRSLASSLPCEQLAPAAHLRRIRLRGAQLAPDGGADGVEQRDVEFGFDRLGQIAPRAGWCRRW